MGYPITPQYLESQKIFKSLTEKFYNKMKNVLHYLFLQRWRKAYLYLIYAVIIADRQSIDSYIVWLFLLFFKEEEKNTEAYTETHANRKREKNKTIRKYDNARWKHLGSSHTFIFRPRVRRSRKKDTLLNSLCSLYISETVSVFA